MKMKIKKSNDLKLRKHEELEELVAKRTIELQKSITLHEKTEKELLNIRKGKKLEN